MLLLGLAAPARAADFCSDRPGLATGTCIVAPHRGQVETSIVSWSLDRSNGTRSTELTIASTTFRLGLAPALEVRATFNPFIRQRAGNIAGSERASGTGDLSLGVKQRLTAADARLGLALLPTIKLPVASRPIGNRRVEAALLVPVSLDLGGGLSLTLTPEADWLADDYGHGHHAGLAGVASLGTPLTDRLSAAVDIAAARNFDPTGHSGGQQAALSVAWMALPNLQLDAQANARLGGDASDHSFALGFAYRP